ncbi:uncharacterized protein LOC127839459 isoform X3 [Dreissena polymorpha]|uniref:uncharacterized protein LOC127839459 isoform X3 n=1 Tax=Dreissena polymorpha TaxID=45954 RepID=UPI002264927B|nr:uncharacterized protein LOC127839459 isoform X3 [Dreissena polymorpha]
MRVSQCSKSCSEGMQITEYQCFKSTTSDIQVADFLCPERPKLIDVCNHGPCVIDPVGCSNLVPDCKGTYGHDICYGTYKPWAEVNCKATCGVCAHRGAVDRPRDVNVRCEMYYRKDCLHPDYRQYMSAHCGRYCCHCYIDGNLCRS